MNARPRGYGAPLGTLIVGLLALIVFNLTRHTTVPGTPHASVHPTVTVTPHSTRASPAGQAPASRGAPPPTTPPLTAAVAAGSRTAAHSGPGATPAPIPAPTLPGPTPSQPPRTGLGVIAAVVVPLRGATPVAVRAAIVVPAAPPYPDLLLQADLNLRLH